jgi:hypothetical protein
VIDDLIQQWKAAVMYKHHHQVLPRIHPGYMAFHEEMDASLLVGLTKIRIISSGFILRDRRRFSSSIQSAHREVIQVICISIKGHWHVVQGIDGVTSGQATMRAMTSIASVATHELLLEMALAVRITKDLLEQRTIIKEVTGLTAKVANMIRANSRNKLVRRCKTGLDGPNDLMLRTRAEQMG